MDDTDRGFRLGLTGLLIAIAAWGVVDLVLDAPEHWLTLHVLVEVGFVLLTLASVIYLWLGWMRARRSLGNTRDRLASNEIERVNWKARATRLLNGLAVEIDAQFERWSLTPAEREVAMLMLKGLGHKQAASVLDRSERTVRQHAVSVYRKSGLAGRAELSAFFLEDLLLPIARGPQPEATGDAEAAGQTVEQVAHQIRS